MLRPSVALLCRDTNRANWCERIARCQSAPHWVGLSLHSLGKSSVDSTKGGWLTLSLGCRYQIQQSLRGPAAPVSGRKEGEGRKLSLVAQKGHGFLSELCHTFTTATSSSSGGEGDLLFLIQDHRQSGKGGAGMAMISLEDRGQNDSPRRRRSSRRSLGVSPAAKGNGGERMTGGRAGTEWLWR